MDTGRVRGVEILDQPGVDPVVVRRAMRDVVRANRLFGGAGAVAAEFAALVPALPCRATLLDVGTGMGDIPALARRIAASGGVTLETVGLDASETCVRSAAAHTARAVCGDARALPFADKSVDVVICSQVLHHFFDSDLVRLVQELDRVARVRVIIGDLLRSRLAAALFRGAAYALRFHPISRHDGLVSIGRGFTPRDLASSIVGAIGTRPRVESRLGWRVTASWAPESPHLDAAA